jgi:SpoIID/LytB domain protein
VSPVRLSPRRLVLAGVAATLAVGGLTACVPTTTPGSDVFLRPANGVFTISGHGWGHGRGMSQWGAQGAATLGVPADQILATYYPGTAKTIVANATLRVLLTADDTVDEQVLPAAGLTVADGLNRTMRLPGGPRRWRVLADPTGLHLQRLDAAWTTVPVAGAATLSSPVRFTSGTGLVSVVFPDGSSRDYRGTATAVRRSTGGLYSTVALPMESYLRGVVPQEASASWKPAALQAQAVAARTYAAQRRASAALGSAYDICDSTACQVFSGTARTSATGSRTGYEYASSDAAVAATAGHIRTYAGKAAFTEFSSSNGGWSVSGGEPYLPARSDPWDGAASNSVHSWSASLPVSALEARYPAVGHLVRLRVTARDGHGDWGGRVTTVVLEGTDKAGRATSVTTTGSGIVAARTWPSYADGLRSTWWTITNGGTTAATLAGSSSTGSSSTGSGNTETGPVPALRATPVTLPPVPTLTLAAGRSAGELSATFRNTGSKSWTLSALTLAPVTGADAVLAAGRPSVSARDLTRAGNAVLPGDSVEVRARLDADAVRAAAGTYQVSYQLVAPGFVLSAPVRWDVPVRAASYPAAPALHAESAGLDAAPVLVRPAGTGEVVARFRDAGTRTWTLSALRLGPVAGRDAAYVAPGAAVAAENLTSGSATVRSGDVIEVRARLSAAAVPTGTARATFRLVAPGFLLSDPVSWAVPVR